MFDSRVQRVIDRVDALRHEVDDHWQVPADEARLLGQLVRVGRRRSICEIGTSYGFSTLHQAAATQPLGGRVHTIDISPRKTAAATEHLREAGLLEAVTLHTGRAQDVLAALPAGAVGEGFDFVFIDAVKAECFEYLEAVRPHLAARHLLATDNTDTHWEEVAAFVEHLRSLDGYASCNVPVGNGFELTVSRG